MKNNLPKAQIAFFAVFMALHPQDTDMLCSFPGCKG